MIATLTKPTLSQRVLCPQRTAVAPGQRSSVVMRFQENKRPASAVDKDQLEDAIHKGKPTDTKLTPDEIESLRYKEAGQNIYYPSSSEISPKTADMRADLGNASDLWQAQSFDGPAPETINGRLCMLAVPLCLWWEAQYQMDIVQQIKDHPYAILAVFVIISLASYVPIARGYTRKEPFSNHFAGLNWTPKAENWNGRVAMLGFTGILITEALSNMPAWQFWLNSHPILPGV